ncbi:MAG: GNAT family N-acetyltransferase [Actinomycetota bacterium]
MPTATFTLRAPTTDDVPAVVSVITVEDTRAGEPFSTTAEEVLHRWQAPGFDSEKMVRLTEVRGAVVGIFTLEPGTIGTARSGGFVLPEHRGAGIGTALLRWGIEAARALGIRTLFTSSNEPDSFGLIEREGFTYARTFVRMVNHDPATTAPPEWPPGVHLVSLQRDALVNAVVEAIDGSFIDHWNYRPTDPNVIRHELEEPGEDPTLWFVALGDDGRAAGCNLCHLKVRDGVVHGYLGPIGTTRPFRGIGLGRALLRHGVLEMAARGAVDVMLGVDAENPSNAVALYEHNGFARARELRVFSKEL